MAIRTRFEYVCKLNGETLPITLGATVVDKLEEALDEGALHLPITTMGYEYKMYGLLTLSAKDTKANITKNFAYLVTDDKVKAVSKSGYYSHDLTVVEYSQKMQNYLIKTLTFTQPINSKGIAPFTTRVRDTDEQWYFHNIRANAYYSTNETIKIAPTPKAKIGFVNIDTAIYEFTECDVYVYTNEDSTKHVISNGIGANLSFSTTGLKYIYFGFVNQKYNVLGYSTKYGGQQYVDVFTFFVTINQEVRWSLYDFVDRIRASVPLEKKSIHEQTRLFDLDPNLEDRFKAIKMPQIFLTESTLKQALDICFKYINAISRLQYVEIGKDKLTVDDFNKVAGVFDKNAILNFETSQNIDGYATNAITWLEQSLQDNFRNNPSIKESANGRWKTVRSKEMKLIQDSFKLPLEREQYFSSGLFVRIKKVQIGNFASGNLVTLNDFNLELSGRFLPKEEWDLKVITNDFPSYQIKYWNSPDVGNKINRNENLFWEQFTKVLDFSYQTGDFYKANLIINVIDQALQEYFTLNSIYDGAYFSNSDLDILWSSTTDIDDTPNYRSLSFDVEYITLENTVSNVDRNDITNINYYSELRQNQMVKITNFNALSRNASGNLERSGVPNLTFSKRYTSFADSDFYEVGMRDDYGYVITKRGLQFYNDFIEATFEATKDHNRISQFMGIDQEFRWSEIVKSNKALERNEVYTDYIYICAPNTTITNEMSYLNNNLIRDSVARILNRDTNNKKITFAFVRTDGFLSLYPDAENNYKAVMTPVVAFGGGGAGKGSLVFSFGFNSNQLVGYMLEKTTNGIWNKAVRYTDTSGQFNELWFGLGQNYNETEYDEIGATKEEYLNKDGYYPLIRFNEYSFGQTFLIQSGYADPMSETYDPLVLKKDSSEIIKLNMRVGILGEVVGDFVIGNAYFVNNRLVNSSDDFSNLLLYKYKDNTKYNVFDDLLVKTSDYCDIVELIGKSVVGQNISLNIGNVITFLGNAFMTSEYTSWAIADGDGNLYLACNKNYNGFALVAKHKRIGLTEIGNK